MKITQKRISLRLSSENVRELERLAHYFGENQSQVMIRGLHFLAKHYEALMDKAERDAC